MLADQVDERPANNRFRAEVADFAQMGPLIRRALAKTRQQVHCHMYLQRLNFLPLVNATAWVAAALFGMDSGSGHASVVIRPCLRSSWGLSNPAKRSSAVPEGL